MYKVFKNYLHNTLQITKAEIREMVEAAVVKVVERKLEVMYKSHWSDSHTDGEYSLWTMERVIDDAIRSKADRWWGESKDSFNDYIKDRVATELLSGVGLKVEVTGKKKVKK